MPTDTPPKDQNTAEDYQNLFILAKTPTKPFLTRNNILAVLACAIALRPLFFTFVDESGPILLELCLNSAAWIAVVAAYKFVSKNSIRKRWWVVASGTLSFLHIYIFILLVHYKEVMRFIGETSDYYHIPPVLTHFIPIAACLASLFFAVTTKGKNKILFYYITLLFLLIAIYPIAWVPVAVIFWSIFGFV